MKAAIAFAAVLLTATPAAAQHDTATHALHAALADPARPAADRERDAARHPAELLALAGVKPGAKVADFIMGGGYWTRIMAKAVGPQGKVYAYQPGSSSNIAPPTAPSRMPR
jgi:predicted methyltransferase